ncbi:MAG: hypothetical protein AB1Z98_18460, partial [Nannocystaceae bacterium]
MQTTLRRRGLLALLLSSPACATSPEPPAEPPTLARAAALERPAPSEPSPTVTETTTEPDDSP